MSFVFALALPRVALIAADTRINVTVNGVRRIDDANRLELDYPDGRTEVIEQNNRKMCRTKFGWAGGVGAFLLVHPVLRRLEGIDNPADVLRITNDVYESERLVLARAAPHLVDGLPDVRVAYTYHGRTGFHLGGFDFNTHQELQTGTQYALLTPPELPEQILNDINRRIQVELSHGATEAHVRQNIRALASLFHTVHINSTSVSDILELGIVQSDRRGLTYRQLIGRTEELSAASDIMLNHTLHSA